MNYRIAVLGSRNAGKTSFLQSFENDISDYSPQIIIKPLAKEALSNQMGTELRFVLGVPIPNGSSNSNNTEQKQTIQFSLLDISDVLLSPNHQMSSQETQELYIKTLQNTNAWIVILDGDCFDSLSSSQKSIRKYARFLVPLASEYAERNSGISPEFMFVISKANPNLIQFMNAEGHKSVYSLIENAFGGIMPEASKPKVLFSDITVKTSVVGVFSLIFHLYEKSNRNEIQKMKLLNEKANSKITQCQREINIANQKTFKSKSTIESLQAQVTTLQNEVSNNNSVIISALNNDVLEQISFALTPLFAQHTAMLVNGFDKAAYSYNCKETKPYYQNYLGKIKAALIIFGIWACYIVVSANKSGQITKKSDSQVGLIEIGVIIALVILYHVIAAIAKGFDQSHEASRIKKLQSFYVKAAKKGKKHA